MSTRLFSLILILSVLCTAVAVGQRGATLTFDGAVATALSRNLSILQAGFNVDASRSSILAGYGTYLPSLSGSGGWSRNQSVVPAGSLPPSSISTGWSAGLNANWTIFDGLRREGGLGSVLAQAASIEEQNRRTRQQIVYLVQSSYLNVLRNEQLVKVSKQNLDRDQKQLDRITEQNRVGALSIGDVYRQQAQVSNDEFGLISAENTYDKSVTDLISLIGLDVSQEFVVADSSIDRQLLVLSDTNRVRNVPEFGVMRAQAIGARSDYQSARQSLRSADNGVMSAYSGYIPSLSAHAGYSTSSADYAGLGSDKYYSWGLTLSWTLFDGFATNSRIQSAVATQRGAEINLQQTERNVMSDVKKALLDLESSLKAYDASGKALVSATQDFRVAQEKYNLGSGTLVDLQVANAGYVTAAANQINAAYNYITAKWNLEFAVGTRTY